MGDAESQGIVRLNIGGVKYTTTLGTLCKYPTSMLGAMFNGSLPAWRDADGSYFIDRDGALFGYVLNFLRSSQLALPKGFNLLDQLAVEADFYQIEPLIGAVSALMQDSTRARARSGRVLQVTEVRIGMAATMPTNNSRVRTIVSGRHDVISGLPSDFFGLVEKLHNQATNQGKFIEMELHGSTSRLRLAEHLRSQGWQLVSGDFSSSSGYDTKGMVGSLILEQSYRDSWFLPDDQL